MITFSCICYIRSCDVATLFVDIQRRSNEKDYNEYISSNIYIQNSYHSHSKRQFWTDSCFYSTSFLSSYKVYVSNFLFPYIIAEGNFP
jgi:hypothetical protein